MFFKKTSLPDASQVLPDRAVSMALPEYHHVLKHRLLPPYPNGIETTLVGMGCFWGAERLFWQQPGVYLTAVGYAGGLTKNPSYDDICTGLTGHTEVVKIWFYPEVIPYQQLLRLFFEAHNPTQGMRQGNDVGTQYRSALYTCTDQQQQQAEITRLAYQNALEAKGLATPITTEIMPAPEFYFAETYHQQYLAKNPGGYCGLKGLGVACPIPSQTNTLNPDQG